MRLATYNHMFGCDGRSLWGFLYVHALHKSKKYKIMEKLVDLHATMKVVGKANTDILGINEVFGERQRNVLIEALKTQGYTHFHVGKGHALTKEYGFVESLLATRMPSTQIFAPVFTLPNQPCYGGGIVGVYIPEKKLYIIQLHLALLKGKRRHFFLQQAKAILQEVEKIRHDIKNPKIILMGDFNSRYKDFVRAFPELSSWKKLSSGEPSCSTTKILRWFYGKDIDHILGFGLQAKANGMLEGMSDHRLVWADIEI